MNTAQIYPRTLCPAKLNLVLRIGPVKSDGFHPIGSLMVPVAFGDFLELKVRKAKETKVKLRCSDPRLSTPKNLVVRTAELFSKLSGLSFEAEFVLKKNVPTGMGVGGGSSDAAMGILMLSDWSSRMRKKIPVEVLEKTARSIGSDIPFFLSAQPAWCMGRGEKRKLVSFPRWDCVLVFPSSSVSTPWAYKTLDKKRNGSATRESSDLNRPPDWLREVLKGQKVLPLLENDFEDVVFENFPNLSKVKSLLGQTGAMAAQMSGSGACVFGLYASPKDAQRACDQLRKRGLNAIRTWTL